MCDCKDKSGGCTPSYTSDESRYPSTINPEPTKWKKARNVEDQFEPGYPHTMLDETSSDPYTYAGEQLAGINFPLGGFGAGQVELVGDGTLQGWLVLNQQDNKDQLGPLPSQNVPSCFFAVSAEATGQPAQTVSLISPLNYTAENCAKTRSGDAFVHPEQVTRMQTIPGIRSLSLRGRYPIAEVDYDIAGFPVEVSMEAMSPLVPGELQNSAWPAAVFTFSFKNTGKTDVKVRLMESQQNFVGWNGNEPISGPSSKGFGGNVNTPVTGSSVQGLSMTSQSVTKGSSEDGSVFVGAIVQSGVDTAVISQANADEDLFSSFSSGAEVPIAQAKASAVSPSGTTYCGGVVQSVTVPAGQTKEVKFVLSWYFPNRLCSATGLANYVKYKICPERLGAKYETWYANASAVASGLVSKLADLAPATRTFIDAVYSTSIPPNFIISAAGRASLTGCPTMFWTQAGIIHGYEGNHCCPLNCSHVYGYGILLERLYPEAARDMMYSAFQRTFKSPSGCSMRYGTGGWAIDGALASVIKAYMCVRQSDSSKQWLATIWSNVKAQMDYIIEKFDTENDGCIRAPQQNTYDTAMNGANTFIGSYYVTALKAASKMATLMGDSTTAAAYSDRAKMSGANYEKICWNEEYGYYTADVTIKNCKYSYGPGCFIDQLCATALSFACDLGSCFNAANEATARLSINKYNYVHAPPFKDLQKHLLPGDSAHVTCTYPNGKLGDGMKYDTLVSIGWVYPVIAGLIHDRNIDEAESMTAMIRQRQDGRNRSPWNEPECNTHYSRMFSGWGLYDQACGFTYDATAGSLGFDPRYNPTAFNCFVPMEGGWATYVQKGTANMGTGELKLACQRGAVQLQSLQTRSTATHCTATVGGSAVGVTVQPASDGLIRLVFASTVKLSAGSTLDCVLSGGKAVSPTVSSELRARKLVPAAQDAEPIASVTKQPEAVLQRAKLMLPLLALVFVGGLLAGSLLHL